MIKFSPFGSTSGQRSATAPARPDSPVVQACCRELLADLPERHRDPLLVSLPRLRRADDFWQLRSAMFTAIAVNHGEAEAQRRIAEFDRRVAD